MEAQSKIFVNSLPREEAWTLFTRVVGERVEKDANLKLVAEEVAKECGGLPLFIKVVGNALKNKTIISWKAALSQLKKPAPSEIDTDIRRAFTRLQLSYDYLESEKAKSCFLLCSMFPEDYTISLEDLVYYMVGLEEFKDMDSMEDARDRVRNAVNMLTSACLLLKVEDDEGSTKMHDVVRDVALLIASKGNNKFLVEAGKGLKDQWPPRNKSLESYTGISLMHNNISTFPDYEVNLSSLVIFLVHKNEYLHRISDKFIEGMKEVKVLDMRWCMSATFPRSLNLLTKIRMLNLAVNLDLYEISILGEMKDLEILILNDTGIRKIPEEIGWLVKLRRLEVSNCNYLSHITPGVISKLQSLEELCIDLGRMSEGVNGCIAEVMKLSKLTYLDLIVKRFKDIPEDGFTLKNLQGFVIQIGYIIRAYKIRTTDRYLFISSEHLVNPLLKWLKKLVEVSHPHIILSEIENLNNMMPALYDEGFNKLESIDLSLCFDVSCLVDDGTKRCDGDEVKAQEKFLKELKHLKLNYLNKLEVLWKCPDEYVSLTNLVTLNISACEKLERVFRVSVANGLINLKKMLIQRCEGIEEVIYGGGDNESGNVIVFPSLVTISFFSLPRLKSFNSAAGNCRYPSLVEVKIVYCESMEIWGPGVHETPKLKSLEKNGHRDERIVPLDGPFAINEAVEKSWRKDQVITIDT